MEVEAINRVVGGGMASAAALEDFLRSVVWSVAAETAAAAGRALVQLLLALGSFSGEIGVVTGKEEIEERFNMPVVVRSNKNQATPEAKDDGETDDDNDEDEDDDDDVDDQDEDGGEEEFSGDDGNEGEDDDDPEANGEGGSEDEDDDDEEEDDDGEEEEEDEEEDDDEEEEQPPSKKRK